MEFFKKVLKDENDNSDDQGRALVYGALYMDSYEGSFEFAELQIDSSIDKGIKESKQIKDMILAFDIVATSEQIDSGVPRDIARHLLIYTDEKYPELYCRAIGVSNSDFVRVMRDILIVPKVNKETLGSKYFFGMETGDELYEEDESSQIKSDIHRLYSKYVELAVRSGIDVKDYIDQNEFLKHLEKLYGISVEESKFLILHDMPKKVIAFSIEPFEEVTVTALKKGPGFNIKNLPLVGE